MGQKIVLTTRQILLSLAGGIFTLHQAFDAKRLYQKTYENFCDWREIDKKRFADDLRRLKREGIVKIYSKDRKNVVELTGKGEQKVKLIIAKDYKYKYPKRWDRKWRLVIFDIPEKKKINRNILREKLKEVGYIQLQKSVFIFPFDTKELVDYLKNLLSITGNVQYVIAETVETEINLVDIFLQRQILNKKMIGK